MDKLYIGDIPKEYHYAIFNNNYIDLYNTSHLDGNSHYVFYRLFLYDNLFLYRTSETTTTYGYSYYPSNVEVTDNILYRRDMPEIVSWTFILVIGFVFLINIVTSFIKKGGIFGGLL